jgi:toxin ParE1/3/4
MVNLRYSPTAIADLKSIYDFISQDSRLYAKKFIRELREYVTVLKKHPDFGFPAFPVRYKNLRQVLYKSYRIVYLFENDIVYVITVAHQHRLPENIPVLTQFEI